MTTSWLVLVMIVMAPTAISPPNFDRLDVKLIERILSVDNITKLDIPSARHGPIILPFNLKSLILSFNIVLLPVRNLNIHIAPTA